jgi:hypothetical protein
MSQQSSMADEVHQRVRAGPVPAATLVAEIHGRWGDGHGVGQVHTFVEGVVASLLRDDDVDVGDRVEGQWVSWQLGRAEALKEVAYQFARTRSYFDDELRIIFQFKGSTNPLQ